MQYKTPFPLSLSVWIATILLLLLSSHSFATEIRAETSTEVGRVTGGKAYELPAWFKNSFLEIQEDVSEAKQANKHLMLFFHLNGCPYCEKMLSESIDKEPMKSYIQQNFDVIGINTRGAREVAFNETLVMTESALSDQLQVQSTPTILFLDENNNVVVRLNGYRSSQRFEPILRYVADKAYQKMTLSEYVAENTKDVGYTLRDNALFTQLSDFSAEKNPFMVIFEDNSCDACNAFHDDTLSLEAVQNELKTLKVVRLDAKSTATIIDPQGNKTTPAEWVKTLQLTYRPGAILFDQGKEQLRIDGMLYPFHFKEMVRYVSGRFYQKYANFLDYLQPRQEELLSQGININLAE